VGEPVRWFEASSPWLTVTMVVWAIAVAVEVLRRRRLTAELEAGGCRHCGEPWRGERECSSCQRVVVSTRTSRPARLLFDLGALAAGPAIGIILVHLLTGR
jgi:hypothetical protein